MDTRYFTAQDSTGERRRVRIVSTGHDAIASGHPRDGYALDDGSPVRRVDNDTFQVVSSGAYITRVPE
ncbi:hypothetical protein SAMN05428989_4081 [Pseudoxanthomonas sp. GM95]|uniref:hypothetical protein n=1 Tax=Pseudoxanthomonas sp. GM95 TaxID=1881043 RepID=UPI0008B9B044|nr:hypothetical protein [Pseudoxanthomonas sp. GM95]SEM57136.1 hypothetical protein SAMN05428989_4081 [Pseudoxanthomonas sp. GM95]